MQVRELMREAIIIRKDIPLYEAARLMSSKGMNSLLFISDKKLKGIITERDLLKNFNRKGRISSIMSKKVITIDSQDDVQSALDIMKKYNKKRLPVVEKGKLVGIIGLIDIARNADELEDGFFFD